MRKRPQESAPTRRLDYDEARAAQMLSILLAVRPEQQMDTLAVVSRVWLDGRQCGGATEASWEGGEE